MLLILAGISIATLTGENGLIPKASKAKEETKKAEYLEELQVIGLGLQPERNLKKWKLQEYMNRYEEEIRRDRIFEKAQEIKQLENTESITIQVTTEEGWIYWITEEGVELKGKQGEDIPPDLNTDLETGNVEFIYEPTKWTNTKVKVEIRTKIEGYQLQYSIDQGNTWENYKEVFEVENNNTAIYARLMNHLGEVGGIATGNIENIDRLKPKIFIPQVETTETTITLKGNTIDEPQTQIDGCSGVQKYYFSKDNGITWEPESGQKTGEYTFEGLRSKVDYELKMKVVDEAGNEMETETITKSVQSLDIYVSLTGNTLNFYDNEEDARKGEIFYGNIRGKVYTRGWNKPANTPWINNRSEIERINFETEVLPTNISCYFANLGNLIQIQNFQNLNTKNVTNMNGLFAECSSLKEIDLSTFDTSNVQSMDSMFYKCVNLTNLDVSKFNTSKVTNMNSMFANCERINNIRFI